VPTYKEILAWSRMRPLSQQDALRRLVRYPWTAADTEYAVEALKAARALGPGGRLAAPQHGQLDGRTSSGDGSRAHQDLTSTSA
jgi:hypothetical protein